MCTLGKTFTLRIWITRQQFQKKKGNRRAFRRCAMLNKLENRTTKGFFPPTKKHLGVVPWPRYDSVDGEMIQMDVSVRTPRRSLEAGERKRSFYQRKQIIERVLSVVITCFGYTRACTKTLFTLSTELWSVRGGHGSTISPLVQVCYCCLWLCCRIACWKYELIPLHWKAPRPNKGLDGSSAPLMDGLPPLHTTQTKRWAPMNIYH